MHIKIVENYHSLSLAAAQVVAELLNSGNQVKIGFPTGSTPLGLYAELVRRHREEGLSFSKAYSFNLDEYIGLAAEAPQSYHSYMWQNLFRHIDIPAEHIFLPDGSASDVAEAAAAYAAILQNHGPLDLLILGIGSNGHIGFNEPESSWEAHSAVVDLAPETLKANARYFGGDIELVPRQAITMGIAEMLRARRVLLLASGEAKAKIIRTALYEPMTKNVPASALQQHPCLRVLLDQAASALLPGK